MFENVLLFKLTSIIKPLFQILALIYGFGAYTSPFRRAEVPRNCNISIFAP